MKGISKVLVLVCLAFFFIGAAGVQAAQKVVVVSGVSKARAEEVGTYLAVYDGIEAALSEKGITPEFQYAELGAAPDKATKEKRGKEAAEKAMAADPDVVVVLDDECVKYVGLEVAKQIPVVFGYIFSAPKALGLPQPNITGITRRSYAPDIWSLANQLFGAKTVALLSKDSQSMAGVRKVLMANADKLEQGTGVRVEEMYLCDTFDQWSDHVKNWKQDLIYLADTSRIQKADGTTMSRSELTSWTVENAEVPVIAAAEKDAEAGAVFAVVASERQNGYQAGKMALKILDGTPVSEIPMEESTKGNLLINAKTVEKMGVDIPYDVLSSADKIYE